MLLKYGFSLPYFVTQESDHLDRHMVPQWDQLKTAKQLGGILLVTALMLCYFLSEWTTQYMRSGYNIRMFNSWLATSKMWHNMKRNALQWYEVVKYTGKHLLHNSLHCQYLRQGVIKEYWTYYIKRVISFLIEQYYVTSTFIIRNVKT